jgi:anaerobic dimethyl sulfoxide reductase subunit C (anchor subunit)
MVGSEWPLVYFTILVQMSVGLLIVSEVACLTGGAAARDLLRGRESFSFVLGAVGLAFSFGHLGSPMHSPFALFNLAHSWLSREILCTSIFLASLVALAITRYTATFKAFARPVAVVAFVVGLATVYVMSQVYMIVTVPAWNSPATLLNFVGAALLLGSLAAGLLAYFRWPGEDGAETRTPIACIMSLALLFAGLGLLAKFIEIPISLFAGLETNARGVSATAAVLTDGLGPYVLQIVLLIVGTALFVYVANAAMRGNKAVLSMVGIGAFLITLAGEVLGRFAFFDMHVLIGL